MDRAARKDIPAGAVVMNRGEALDYMYKKVYTHKPVQDVIALKYGSAVAGGAASLTGFFALQHFRKNLGLRKEASISSNMLSLFLPCMTTFIYHYLFITPPILLEEKYCKICLEMKSAGIQATLGFVSPWALGMVSASLTATKLGVHMPTVVEPIKLIKLSYHLANKGNGPAKFTGLFAFNVLGAIFLVTAEEMQVLTFKRRLLIRRELDQD